MNSVAEASKQRVITQKDWPLIVKMLNKYARYSPVRLPFQEADIIKRIDSKRLPVCNPECEDFYLRGVPNDFDLRVIDYLSTNPVFSTEDREIIHQAIMSYDASDPLIKLSVHVIREFRKALAGDQNQKNELEKARSEIRQLESDNEQQTQYAEKLLGEIAFLTSSIQKILGTSTNQVTDSEKAVINAFSRDLPSNDIISLIKSQNRRLIQYLREESRKMSLDPLTGLFNRGTLDYLFPKILSECKIARMPCSVMMIDIDHFKRINDTYGHLVGDEALKFLARHIKHQVESDSVIAARFGGEEFVVVLKGYDLRKARSMAESLRVDIAGTPFTQNGLETQIDMTISVGVAEMQAESTDPEYLIDTADKAMYKAKKSGRNKVCIHEASLESG